MYRIPNYLPSLKLGLWLGIQSRVLFGVLFEQLGVLFGVGSGFEKGRQTSRNCFSKGMLQRSISRLVPLFYQLPEPRLFSFIAPLHGTPGSKHIYEPVRGLANSNIYFHFLSRSLFLHRTAVPAVHNK
jgi:hypothetical protein